MVCNCQYYEKKKLKEEFVFFSELELMVRYLGLKISHFWNTLDLLLSGRSVTGVCVKTFDNSNSFKTSIDILNSQISSEDGSETVTETLKHENDNLINANDQTLVTVNWRFGDWNGILRNGKVDPQPKWTWSSDLSSTLLGLRTLN